MLSLKQVSALSGTIQVPGDKSISHRAVMFGSIADGTTKITNFLSAADCLSTIDCFRRLGIDIQTDPLTRTVTVHGQGMHGLHPARDPAELYTGNSGTTTRIISGILGAQPFTSILSGDESINQRPMRRIIEPLTQMGVHIESVPGNGCCPLRIRGDYLHGITYRTPVASAQVKSAILCAGLYADSPTTVIESAPSRDHTERMLQAFGASVRSHKEDDGFHVDLAPAIRLSGQDIHVPGDISSAAYFIAAALLVPDAEILVKNVGMNPTRSGILSCALAMGANITIMDISSGAEPTADLLIRSSKLHGVTIEGDRIPTLIDEIPVIAVMAALADGETIIRDAADLRAKESDRIATVTENLRAMGADITPTDDGMIIRGVKQLHGAQIHTHADHRIAMSFAVAALIAGGETVLDDESCVRISYPSFFGDLQGLVRR